MMIDVQKSLTGDGSYREGLYQHICYHGHSAADLSMLIRQYHEADGMKYETVLKAMIFHLWNKCDDLLERLATAEGKLRDMPKLHTFQFVAQMPGDERRG